LALNKALTVSAIVGVVIALILIGALLSTSLTDIVGFSSQNVTIDGSTTTVATANPTVSTLVSTVLPIMAVIGLVLLFIPKKSDD
jgi:uncharacterized membrane protein YkvI